MKNGKHVKPSLLQELYDKTPGPSPEPVMWIADAIYLPSESAILGPYQTWYEARREAQLEYTRRYGWYIAAVEVQQL